MIKYCEEYWDDVAQVVSVIPQVNKLRNHAVFITGATGMICSVVAEVLFWLNKHRNFHVKIYLGGRNKNKMSDRFYLFNEGTDYHYVPYNASSGKIPDVLADYIIDGASPADPASFGAHPVETIMANILGLKGLLELADKNKSTRLLYISSSEVYGRKKDSHPYSESDFGYVDILNPRACYPSAKRASETLCAAYLKEYGVDYVIARPGHIYGPSITDTDSRASAQFTRKVAMGEDIVLKSAGNQVRSYCYTLDCAAAILTVLVNGKSGEAYNISNPDSVCTIRNLAEAFAKVSGNKVIFESPSDEEKRSYNLMDNSSLNSTKISKLGWHGYFDIYKGVEKTIKYFGI